MRRQRGPLGRTPRWRSRSGPTANVPPRCRARGFSQCCSSPRVAVAGCGRKTPATDPERPRSSRRSAPRPPNLGFPELATKNTTRVPGTDATATGRRGRARGLPRPDPPPGRRHARRHERLARRGRRLRADGRRRFNAPDPVHRRHGHAGPVAAARSTRSHPQGSDAAGKAQVIRIGNVAKPAGYKSSDVDGQRRVRADARRSPSLHPVREARQDGVASSSRAPTTRRSRRRPRTTPRSPATRSCSSRRTTIPPETRAALAALGGLSRAADLHPRPVERHLAGGHASSCRASGASSASAAQDPVTNAIAVARYKDGAFGWGVVDPGHGLVFVRSGRPLDAVAASRRCRAPARYGPLLLLDDPGAHAAAVQQYLLDIQPGYNTDPVDRRSTITAGSSATRGAISVAQQARIDALLEIVRAAPAPPTPYEPVSQAEHPDRLSADHQVTLDDVRQLMGASTPHFALQLRNRIAKLIRGLPGRPPGADRGRARGRAADRARPRRRGPRPRGRAGHGARSRRSPAATPAADAARALSARAGPRAQRYS